MYFLVLYNFAKKNHPDISYRLASRVHFVFRRSQGRSFGGRWRSNGGQRGSIRGQVHLFWMFGYFNSRKNVRITWKPNFEKWPPFWPPQPPFWPPRPLIAFMLTSIVFSTTLEAKKIRSNILSEGFFWNIFFSVEGTLRNGLLRATLEVNNFDWKSKSIEKQEKSRWNYLFIFKTKGAIILLGRCKVNFPPPPCTNRANTKKWSWQHWMNVEHCGQWSCDTHGQFVGDWAKLDFV